MPLYSEEVRVMSHLRVVSHLRVMSHVRVMSHLRGLSHLRVYVSGVCLGGYVSGVMSQGLCGVFDSICSPY